MARFTGEQIAQAKEASLTALAAQYGYHPVRVGNHLFTLKEHDSIRLYNDRTWYRWSKAGSRGEAGGSQIDFLMQFCNVDSIADAVSILLEFQGISADNPKWKEHLEAGQVKHQAEAFKEKERVPFVLPEPMADKNYRRAYAYLMKTRGLSQKVVDYFVKDLGILYEDKEHHNLVFLGKDKDGVVRYATKRGTTDIYGKKYRGDVAGNDKNFGINIVNTDSEELKVFEASIDLMSYLDLTGDYKSNKLVLGMVADNPLVQFLKDHPHIKKIGFCLDNDEAGSRAMFGKRAKDPDKEDKTGLLEKYKQLGYQTYADIVPQESGCKDWNEYLVFQKAGKSMKSQEETAVREEWRQYIEQHQHMLEERRERGTHNSLVVNAFGGPGAGKSTACFHIVEELKKMGYVTEYVSEYAKDLVWDENFQLLDGTEAHQLEILKEQLHRIDRLYGKVDFIVTDASILLNAIYNSELTPEYEKMLEMLNGQYENFNFLVQREGKFEEEGRIHSYEESIRKDNEVEQMLQQHGLFYGVYNHGTLDVIVKNVQKTHEKQDERRSEQETLYRNTRKCR